MILIQLNFKQLMNILEKFIKRLAKKIFQILKKNIKTAKKKIMI